MKTILLYSSAVLALSPLAARAAGGATEVETVVVTASRTLERIDQVGGQITVLDRAAIQAAQAPIVSDLLARTPGVSVSRNGGPGAATQLRIRGAETDQTVVLIDGVKLNDPSAPGGGYNFAHLLTGDVARIEVLRGAQSTVWGSQAIGGVVNLITAEPQAAFEGRIDAEAGAFETAYVRAAAGGKSEHLAWRASGGYLTSGGISAFDRGRERDGYRNAGAAANAKLSLSESLSLDLRGRYIRGRSEFDGFAPPSFAFGDTAEYGTVSQWVGYGGLSLTTLEGRLDHRLAYVRTRIDSDNFDPGQGARVRTFEAAGRNRRIEYQGTWRMAPAWTAVFGAESERSAMAAASQFSPAPTRLSAKLDGVYGLTKGEVAAGLTLGAGLRLDDHGDFGTHSVGQVQAVWTPNAGATVLRASFGQGFKAPTLYQLGSEYGNRALAPEEADSWDAGVAQRWADGRVTVSAAYFHRTTRNQIDFVSCPFVGPGPLCFNAGARRFGYYDNVARATARGLELEGTARVTEALTLSGNYTWIRSRNASPGSPNRGKPLARRPAHQAYGEAAWAWGNGATAAVSVRQVGQAFDDAANRTRLDAYAVTDIRASWPISDRVEIHGRVENLFDAHYRVIDGYGTPGRGAHAGVRARF